MVTYPLTIHVKPYGGKDARKQLRYRQMLDLARTIEAHVNARMATEYQYIFTYFDIGREVGASTEDVYKVLFPVDCGSNGITIVNLMNKPE
jgi:hypothetical protein